MTRKADILAESQPENPGVMSPDTIIKAAIALLIVVIILLIILGILVIGAL